MSKKIKNNKMYTHIIYPKELSGYVLITLISLLLSFGSIYENFKTNLFKEVSKSEIVLSVTLTIIAIFFSIYLVLSLYKLIYKKIYIKTTQYNLEIKKTFKTQIIKISEIDSIQDEKLFLPNYGFRYRLIKIKTKSVINNKRIIKINFPAIWFSSRNLDDLIDYLRKTNKNIYYRTYPN